MNRTIKFRGLRTDGKGWVYGSLVNNLWVYSENSKYHKQPVCEIIVDGECDDYEEMESNEQNISVIPESVGQFTGLHDKNGIEIYEHDIISISSRGFDFDCQVTYDKQLIPVGEKSKGWEHMLYSPYWEQCEVIGNIHTQDGGQEG